jgi:type IV secretion system protein VirB11
VILEDTPELLNPGPNTVRLLSGGAYSLAQLFRYTLRLRPDRIVVGEVRGAEALQLLKALTTGHPGGFATLHAESALLSLDRLEDYVAEAGVAPRPALLVAAVQVLVHIEGRGQERRVESLYQLDGWDSAAGRYRLTPLS